MRANRIIQKTLWGLGGFALVLAGALFYGLCVRTSKPTFSELTWGVGGAPLPGGRPNYASALIIPQNEVDYRNEDNGWLDLADYYGPKTLRADFSPEFYRKTGLRPRTADDYASFFPETNAYAELKTRFERNRLNDAPTLQFARAAAVAAAAKGKWTATEQDQQVEALIEQYAFHLNFPFCLAH